MNRDSFDFRMHPRRAGAESNAYYALKRATRNGNNGCSGCMALLFLPGLWLFLWYTFYLITEDGTVSLIASIIGIVILVKKFIQAPINVQDTITEDEVVQTERFQRYTFKRYLPDKFPYVAEISYGQNTWRFTREDLRRMWVEYDTERGALILHIQQNTFRLRTRDGSFKDTEHMVDFLRRCAGIDPRSAIPMEPPKDKKGEL